MSALRHLRRKRKTCHWKAENLFDLQTMQVQDFWFGFVFFSSQYFTNCYLFYYTGMPRKNWMISDLILPREKVSRMFLSIKSDCLKYLQQCLIRINSYSQSSLSKKKKVRPLWFNFNLYGKPAWRNINLIVGTFANKLELIAEEQCNAWNSFLLCSTVFNMVPKLWVACDSLQLK